MTHSWRFFEKAKKAYEQLLEAGIIQKKDEKTVRGIIQIVFEEP